MEEEWARLRLVSEFCEEGGAVFSAFENTHVQGFWAFPLCEALGEILYLAQGPLVSSSHCKSWDTQSRAHRVGGITRGICTESMFPSLCSLLLVTARPPLHFLHLSWLTQAFFRRARSFFCPRSMISHPTRVRRIRSVRQFACALLPRVWDQIAAVFRVVPHESVSKHIVEQVVPVPQIAEQLGQSLVAWLDAKAIATDSAADRGCCQS